MLTADIAAAGYACLDLAVCVFAADVAADVADAAMSVYDFDVAACQVLGSEKLATLLADSPGIKEAAGSVTGRV